jgi:sec-independent protein translocase protein TatA
MGSMSIWHWLIVLAIVALVFGTKKLGSMGRDLGSAVHGFKKAMGEGEAEEKARQQLKHEGQDAEFAESAKSADTARDRKV